MECDTEAGTDTVAAEPAAGHATVAFRMFHSSTEAHLAICCHGIVSAPVRFKSAGRRGPSLRATGPHHVLKLPPLPLHCTQASMQCCCRCVCLRQIVQLGRQTQNTSRGPSIALIHTKSYQDICIHTCIHTYIFSTRARPGQARFWGEVTIKHRHIHTCMHTDIHAAPGAAVGDQRIRPN